MVQSYGMVASTSFGIPMEVPTIMVMGAQTPKGAVEALLYELVGRGNLSKTFDIQVALNKVFLFFHGRSDPFFVYEVYVFRGDAL